MSGLPSVGRRRSYPGGGVGVTANRRAWYNTAEGGSRHGRALRGRAEGRDAGRRRAADPGPRRPEQDGGTAGRRQWAEDRNGPSGGRTAGPVGPDDHAGGTRPPDRGTGPHVRGGQAAAGLAMTYAVTWALAAVQELSRIESASADPAGVRKAGEWVDYTLRRIPLNVGESRFGPYRL